MSATFEFTSRYDGIMPLPDPSTMCTGYCEGMGCYPHFVPLVGSSEQVRESKQERVAWEAEHAKAHRALHLIRTLFSHLEWWYWKSICRDLLTGEYAKCDGYHFIKCSECNGTGKANQ